MTGGDLGGPLESGNRRDFLRDTCRQPGADGGLGRVERLGVDTDAIDDHRERRREVRRVLAAYLDLDAERAARVADRGPAAAGAAIQIVVAVQVQPKPGTGAHVDQDEVPAVRHQRRQGWYHVGAAAHLVHLITVLRAEFQQPVPMVEAELAVLGGKPRAQRRLRLAHPREPARQRLRPEFEDQERGRGGEQQGRQLPCRDGRRDVQQLRVIPERLELSGSEAPR